MKVVPRLTYANVVSTLCLFLLLGGGAFAAIKLPKNSVGTKQLKDGAVTGAKVKGGSLLASNFKGGQLPQGPQGVPGPEGPPGLPGTARAYGFVGGLYANELSRSKNASMTNPGEGIFCISVPGISSNDTPILVSLGNQGDVEPGYVYLNLATNSGYGSGIEMSFVIWNQDNYSCPAGTWEVDTYTTSPEAEEEIFEWGMARYNEPFSFVVP